jgi:hypothetical protein
MMSAGKPETSRDALQRQFAAHIRDPDRHPAPEGVEDRRMAIYRELFFNNMTSMLAGNFPVLHTLHSAEAWTALVRDFYARYRCQTPLFTEIAREFVRFLQRGREAGADDPPFIAELAHYEWIEMALELDEREVDDVPADREGDLLAGVPVLSPLACPLSYRYPVHRIGPDYRPTEPPAAATHLLVWRDRNDTVRFMTLNAVARLLLGYLQEDAGASGRQLLERIAAEIGHGKPDQVVENGARLLADLHARDVLLGTRPAAA